MKRLCLALLMLLLLLLLPACAVQSSGGIAPYNLSVQEEELLYNKVGLPKKAQLLQFDAPEEAITLTLSFYSLAENGTWEKYNSFAASIGEERQPIPHLSGSLFIWPQDDFSFGINMSMSNLIKSQVAPHLSAEEAANLEINVASFTYLEKQQDITLNEEIPLALFLYSNGNSMITYSLDDFASPKRLAEVDVAQAITITFSDQPLQENTTTDSTDSTETTETTTPTDPFAPLDMPQAMADYQQVMDFLQQNANIMGGVDDMMLAALQDIDGDGADELMVQYVHNNWVYVQLWQMKDDEAQLVADKQLYILAGGAGRGGIGLTQFEEEQYLCIWYSKATAGGFGPSLGALELEEYLLFSCTDFSLQHSLYFYYIMNYQTGLPHISQDGNEPDALLQQNGEDISAEQFLTLQSQLEEQMQLLVGMEIDEEGGLVYIGTPLGEILQQ